jgi:hypothetical protein
MIKRLRSTIKAYAHARSAWYGPSVAVRNRKTHGRAANASARRIAANIANLPVIRSRVVAIPMAILRAT